MLETFMSHFTRKQRLKIAFGGFLSFLGFMLLIFTLLVIIGRISVEDFFKPELFVCTLVIVGILDVLAGFLLFRSR